MNEITVSVPLSDINIPTIVRRALENPSFRRWFDGSKVVDSKGKPLVVYHGADQQFTVFDPYGKEHAWMADYPEGVIFFSDSPKVASYYGNIIMPVYLRMESPIIKKTDKTPEYLLDNDLEIWQQFYEEGDGIIVHGYTRDGDKISVYVVIEPTQIKSIFNRGTFNPADPDIMK